MSALFALSLRQMLGGKKIWVLAVFLSLPILLLSAVLLAAGFDFPVEEDFDVEAAALSMFLYLMYPQSLCILASLLYGASLLAGEIEDKTLVYLFTRSIPRWQVLVGKYLATATVLTVMTLLSLSVSFLVCKTPGGADTYFALTSAVALACFTYTAIFCLLGLLVPRRALPVGVIYAVVVEGLLSAVPALVNELTSSFYLRSLAWHLAGIELPEDAQEDFQNEVAPFVAGADPSTALTALGIITVSTLLVSAILIHRRQWPLNEGV